MKTENRGEAGMGRGKGGEGWVGAGVRKLKQRRGLVSGTYNMISSCLR